MVGLQRRVFSKQMCFFFIYISALQLLHNSDNLPALVVCSYGKDRTGIFAAIVQSLLGHSRKNIVRDFVISEVCCKGAVINYHHGGLLKSG